MPDFAPEVEDFLNRVIDEWDTLWELEGTPLYEALYALYDRETDTNVRVRTYSPEQLEGLADLHRSVHEDNYVAKKNHYVEFCSPHNFDASSNASPYRIYVNASSNNAIVLGRILVGLSRQITGVGYFKIVDDPHTADVITDSIVIYVFGRQTAELVANELARITGGRLTPTVPALTQKIAPGISIAAESGGKSKLSFGQIATRPFGLALSVYRKQFVAAGLLEGASAETQTEVFRLLLSGAFRAHGLNPLAPFADNGGYAHGEPHKATTIGAAELSLAMRRAARR